MERFVKGDVVVLPFPFSDLSTSKKRPVLVVSNLPGEDIIVCPITSQIKINDFYVKLENKDFKSGKLNIKSFIRTNKLFTSHHSIVNYKIGSVNKELIKQVENKLIEMIKK